MKIKRVYIQGFGRLQDFALPFDERFTLLYGCNEAGKTTVLEFILSMLYGFPSTRIQEVRQNHRVRYKPWSGGAFGGVLTIAHKGVEYEIRRHFGTKKSEDTTSLLHTTSGEELSLGKKEPGEYLLHMTRGEFVNSVFLTQNEAAVASDADILHKLMRTVSGTDSEVTAKEMQSALEAYRKELDNDRARKPTIRSMAVDEAEEKKRQLQEAHAQEQIRLERLAETEEAEEALFVLEKQRADIKNRMENSERTEALARETRLLRLWDETNKKEAALEKEDPAAWPDEERSGQLHKTLRIWTEETLRLASLSEDNPVDTQGNLAEQNEALQEESDALAELEKRWNALTDEGRYIAAETAKERAAQEDRVKEYTRLKAEKERMEEALAFAEKRLQAAKVKQAEAQEKYAQNGRANTNTALWMTAGLLPALAGVLLFVLRTEAIWLLLTAAGVLLFAYALLQKKNPRSDASDALLQEIEQDVSEWQQERDQRHAARQALSKAEAPGAFFLSAALEERKAAQDAQIRQWMADANKRQITGAEEIPALRKAVASRMGILQEKENRLHTLRERIEKTEKSVQCAADAFAEQSKPYFSTDDPDSAREKLHALQQKRQAYQEKQNELIRLKTQIAEEVGDRDRKDVEQAVKELAHFAGQTIVSAEEKKRLEQERAVLEEACKQARERLISGQTRLSEAQKNPIIPATVEQEIRAAEDKLQRIDAEIRATDTALSVLQESLTEMQESFGPELNRVTARHLADMTEEETIDVSVDRKFAIKITDPETRGRWDRGYFSAGKVDQIYLALRMAIAEVVYKKDGADPLPLILDDALDQFDGARGRRTLKKLMQSADTHGHQVLFASCHERIRDYVQKAGGTVIDMDQKA